jgi:hypothetical protein
MSNAPIDKKGRRDLRRRIALACAASAVATVALGGTFWWTRHRTVTAARDRARGEAQRAAKVIDAELTRFQLVVRAVADDLDSGRVSRAALGERLRGAVDATPQMSGIGAAFVPLAWDPGLRLYAPYYERKGESVGLVQLDSLYDYTQGQYEWYHKPLREGPSWSEPALSAADSAAAVEYSAPFRLGGGSSAPPSGVVHGTMSLAEINELVSSLDLGEFGYSFLVSKNGFLISHPFSEEYAPEHRAAATRGKEAERMLSSIPAAGRSSVEEEVDPVTGEPCWVFSEPVPSTGWTVGVVFFNGLSAQNRVLRRQQIRFAVALIVTACLLLAFLLEPYRHAHDVLTLWTGSVIGSLLLVLGIGWLWSIGYGADFAPAASQTVLVDKAGVRRFVLDTTRRSLKRTGDLPIMVPTGVFIQTLEIISPNNVAFTGYVWQKYATNIPKTITRGFVLPDAADRSITEAYRRVDGETETIGWYVKAVIRQNFDYSGYPLDEQDFKLRLWHSDLDSGVVLVPDLDSYRIIHPLARAGLENDFNLPGWTVQRTQFSSRTRDRTTTFGIDASQRNGGTELSFDVIIDRHILEPVFSNLLPLAVSGFMVFALLLMLKESTRVNIIQTLAAYSALFFVIILSQLDLRRRVSGTNILYIEYFYFITYGAMLASALITLTNGWPGILPQIEQREHFYPKLLFWPLTLTALAVITICAFY